MLLKTILTLAFLTFLESAFSQLDNSVFFEREYNFKDSQKQLFLEVQNLNFFRNNEYLEQSSALGRTLFGYQVSPRVAYYLGEKAKISLGLFVWRDFGRESFTELSPYFLLEYQNADFRLKFGNIKGHLQHQLIEPLYAFENLIERNLERGIQLLYQKEYFGIDVWIDWQEFAEAGSNTQEVFFVGLCSYFKLIKKESFTAQIPLQATLRHQGGQGLNTNLPVANTNNLATGLKLEWKVNSKDFFRKVNFENYFVGFQTDLDLPSQTGQAFYSNLHIETKHFALLLSLWLSEGFASSQGGDLYFRGVENEDRNLIFFRLMRDFELRKDLTLTLRAEPFLDLDSAVLEYNFGFYINYQPRFLLAKIKKKGF